MKWSKGELGFAVGCLATLIVVLVCVIGVFNWASEHFNLLSEGEEEHYPREEIRQGHYVRPEKL